MCLITININNLGRYMNDKNILLVDLREAEDFRRGHIPGAVNIPYDEMGRHKAVLSQYREILMYCDRGNTSLRASRELSREGYQVINLYGGIHAYRGRLVINQP